MITYFALHIKSTSRLPAKIHNFTKIHNAPDRHRYVLSGFPIKKNQARFDDCVITTD